MGLWRSDGHIIGMSDICNGIYTVYIYIIQLYIVYPEIFNDLPFVVEFYDYMH
jgi:hypothetical protein